MSGRSATIVTLLAVLIGCAFGYKACPAGYTLVESYCFRVSVDYLTTDEVVNYEEAKALCQRSLTNSSRWKSNLAILQNSEKLQALGKYIYEDLPVAMSSLVFWVGGERLQKSWQWVNGDIINLRSHIWLPGMPVAREESRRMGLVPADKINQRFYANSFSYETPRPLPSYVCEAIQ